MNSFAIAGGRIRNAAAFAAADRPLGFRDLPIDSGVPIDVEANTIIATGLLKPHSVRLFDGEPHVLNVSVSRWPPTELAPREGYFGQPAGSGLMSTIAWLMDIKSFDSGTRGIEHIS
jgi:hypothetical protein